MPSPNVLDLSPTPRRNQTGLEKVIEGYAEGTRRGNEADELKKIYEKYKEEGMGLEQKIQEIRTNPKIGNATKASAVSDLTTIANINAKKQEMALKQAQDYEKKQEKLFKKQEEEIQGQKDQKLLDEVGATPTQKALFEAAPVGGKTKVVQDIIESQQRNAKPGVLSEENRDYDLGLTAKERVKRQDDRFRIQTPLVEANSKSLNSLENENLSIDLLTELNESGKVKKGLRKMNVNPKTGEIFIPEFATAEEQLFAKTINDFTVKAKDSFGARVTNFELDRFMQRLPTLANSEEGRRLIMRQMKVINEINSIEKKSIQGIFDRYGVRNIDYADAENLARKEIAEDKEKLRKEYLNYEKVSKNLEKDIIQKVKTQLNPDQILMRSPQGQLKKVPKKNKSNLEDKGYVSL